MQMQDLVTTISQKLKIDTSLAEKTVGTLLSIVEQQGQNSKAGQLFAKLPGAKELAEQYGVANTAETPSLGLGGKVAGIISGAAGVDPQALNALNALRSDGINASQIQSVVAEIIAYAKSNGSEKLVTQVLSSIPALQAIIPKAA